MTHRRTVLGLTAGAFALSMTPLATPAAASTSGSAVTRWAQREAVAIPPDLTGPGRDLDTIGRATFGARVIGLGEPGHTISEATRLQARYLRHLVEHHGVRAVAFELDWTGSLALNDYVGGRRDDVEALLRGVEGIWRTVEFRDTLAWLRRYNDRHDDKVHICGVEYFATGAAAYDAVEDHVADNAPDRLAELRAHFEWLRPGDDIGEHLREYMKVEDKTPYLEAAEAVQRLVADIEPVPGHAIVVHHATQIHSWYEAFSLPLPDISDYRDARAAENVRWWQRHTDARTVYWAATPHTADVPRVTVTEPGRPDNVFTNAGSHLKNWYGRDYVSIGISFDHGTYRTGTGETIDVPAAAADWFEYPLADVDSPHFVLRLDRRAPAAVRDWLDAPLTTRGLIEYGHESVVSGGTLGQWFDVVVHVQTISPAQPL